MRLEPMDKVRLDKWLWAARFFKTRSLAKAAIEGGKVKVNRQRTKPSREIETGTVLDIQQGWDNHTVEVVALSDQRRGAPEAAKLYRETEESQRERQARAEARRLAREHENHPGGRPTKKQRRLIHQFLDEQSDD